MQQGIQLRPLLSSDFLAVVALWKRCEGVEIAEGDDEATFRSYLLRNPGLSPCAEAGGTLIGAALCGHDGRRGLIYHLAVAADVRGQGVGKAILERALAGLRDLGIPRAVILVSEDNAPGREFWLSQGFEAISGALPLGRDLL